MICKKPRRAAFSFCCAGSGCATGLVVFDVAVGIRKHSATFGRRVGVVLSAENKRMMWIPEGFAHGFFVLSESADCLYKTTDYWYPEYERCIRWDDPVLAIDWPVQGDPALSGKDAQGRAFGEAGCFCERRRKLFVSKGYLALPNGSAAHAALSEVFRVMECRNQWSC